MEKSLNSTAGFEVIPIGLDQVELVAPLFDAYRQFYRQPADLDGARQFLTERIARGESTIIAALQGDRGLGFTQLYPSFSSVAMKPIWILNDLFVAEDARQQGVGARLLRAARAHAARTGAVRLALSTAADNALAQALYHRDGWKQDMAFLHFEFELPTRPTVPLQAE